VVTSVSQNLKDETYRLFDINRDIVVIPNFIEIDRSRMDVNSQCHRSMMATDTQKIITHISNFRKVKRIPDVIRIFYEIQKQIPAKLMMVGDGPERVPAERLCEELGISDKVIFFGNSNEIGEILCFSDLFLLPSETESFGLAALEAMACGVPVISSNTGGLPEVNREGYSGYLGNVGDVQEMAKKALHILSDDDRLFQFKTNALKVAEEFDIQNIMPLYEQLYRKALKQHT
jgi:N-acetyl-alpha-D-glucosaminyl L-malate synthase BshA